MTRDFSVTLTCTEYDGLKARIAALEAALREVGAMGGIGDPRSRARRLLAEITGTTEETTLPLSERVEQKIIDECFGAETACEHDFHKSNCTVEVQQLAKVQRGECTVCHEVWINPPYGVLAFQSKIEGK